MSMCDNCVHWWECDEANTGFCDLEDDDPDGLYWEYAFGDGLDKER